MHSNLHPPESISLNSIQASLNLDFFANRRRYADICFLFKLVNGVISCPDLLQLFNFHIPNFHSRVYLTFEIPFHRISYGINNSIDQIVRECNNLRNVDLFNMNDLYYFNPCFS